MKNKISVESVCWIIGLLVIVVPTFIDKSISSLVIFTLFVILAFNVCWFVVSLFQITSAIRFYITTKKWNYFSRKKWVIYLCSFPSVPLTLFAVKLYSEYYIH
ncbi:hypothetical protein WAF17_14985 [Bernardetia sp. ABR2-2B]|uniref:hypothetical protein n=1 Tax=Bernardetia sp. ABR2-2B TaxID=3127472 RepID=UPI0030CD2EB7